MSLRFSSSPRRRAPEGNGLSIVMSGEPPIHSSECKFDIATLAAVANCEGLVLDLPNS